MYLKLIYPPYFLPHGLLHSIYQLYRRISIMEDSRSYNIVLQMEDEATILVEVFDPIQLAEPRVPGE
jgi:hypothetical protein